MKIDGAKLKGLREARALSLRELAESSDVEPTAISEIERGKRNPHPSTVRKLAAALEVEPKELLEDGD